MPVPRSIVLIADGSLLNNRSCRCPSVRAGTMVRRSVRLGRPESFGLNRALHAARSNLVSAARTNEKSRCPASGGTSARLRARRDVRTLCLHSAARLAPFTSFARYSTYRYSARLINGDDDCCTTVYESAPILVRSNCKRAQYIDSTG